MSTKKTDRKQTADRPTGPKASVGNNNTTPSTPAAMYVCLSSGCRKVSIKRQTTIIEAYAQKHNFQIIEIYSDDKKGACGIPSREVLRSLIHEFRSRKANFQAILVYDARQWGLFQDADESAVYEYVCKRAGIQVHYCRGAI
jgi:DNA invertase Pin-like site-specific DNA recombinase